MSALFTNLVSDLPRLVALVIALLATLIAIAAYWRRQRPSAYAGMQRRVDVPVPAIVYRDTPTVRVADSQRIDRLRKLVRLAPGEHADLLENLADAAAIGVSPRFRITLKRVVRMDDGTAVAHIAVDFGGAAVSCGPLVEEIGFNEFVLPRAARDEPRNCVFHYQENGDALSFMRIKLRGVDMDQDIAELDVMQVSGHWPAT
ncbi:MAG TPA: hypothetical protein VKB34_21965 [Povalibacter sp.]|nr:hypothetical protein [Povalibacter sp.]